MSSTNSKKLYKQAIKCIPGGVNSPVRAFKAVGGSPLFIKRGEGSCVVDEDNNKYIDLVMSWGALILGHAHKQVVREVNKTALLGTSFGAPTKREVELSKLISKAVPSIEMLRLVSSGTEAVMGAIRLSRGFTNRPMILKFSGNYHGGYDPLLVKAGSGAATFAIPISKGLTKGIVKDTLVCEYNNIEEFIRLVKKHHKKIAAVIIEPVAANMGVVLPKPGFLKVVRSLTKKYGIILIFDEVITGFRLCFGGAQKLFGIKPDLTCLGKIIGGGLPVGGYGGRQDIMRRLSPLGNVYQAGTLSGNPVAVAAGLAALKKLAKADYHSLNHCSEKLCAGLSQELAKRKISFSLNRIGSLFTVFFGPKNVSDYKSAGLSDANRYAKYFHLMLNNGIYLAPSQFEANFISFAHTRRDLEKVIKAHAAAIKNI